MEIDDTIMLGLKHIWNLVMLALSAIFSFFLWKAKKKSQEFDRVKELQQEHKVTLAVTIERLENLNTLLTELREDVKEILFNVCKLGKRK